MNMHGSILLVDDTPQNLRLLGSILEQEGYEVLLANNGREALESAHLDPPPDLIFLDVMMPDMDGYEVCRQLKSNPVSSRIPVIFISALDTSEQKVMAFREGAVDYVTKPFQSEEVLARVNTQFQLKLHRDHLQDLVHLQTRKFLLSRDATIASMAILAEFRDPETGEHLKRTKRYITLLIAGLGESGTPRLSHEDFDLLIQSSPLHDIGKVAVTDAILNKHGPLSAPEFDEMKKHTLYGSDVIRRTEKILGENSFLAIARDLVEFHHERWDGSGYPHGLEGDAIPFAARLMMLVDIYDALTSRRPYKEPLSHRDAVRVMTEGDGRTMPGHFDPELLDVFRRIHPEFERAATQPFD